MASDQKALASMQKFNENVEKLYSEFSLPGANCSTRLRCEQGEWFQIKMDVPSDEATHGAVCLIRLFIQDNDKSSFRYLSENVYNDAPSLGITAQTQKNFSDWRERLNTYLDTPSGFRIEEEKYSYRDILNTFTYGEYAHKNNRKREKYLRWKKHSFYPMLHTNYVIILQDIIRFAIAIRQVNLKAMDEINNRSP